ILPLRRPRRAARQHLGDTCRAVVRRHRLTCARRSHARADHVATSEPVGRRRAHGRGFGAPLTAQKPGGGHAAAGRIAGGGATSPGAAAPPHEAVARRAETPGRREEAARPHETTAAPAGRVTPIVLIGSGPLLFLAPIAAELGEEL